MINLLTFCLLTSLKITAIHVACWQGMILFKARNYVGRLLYSWKMMWLEKPLYDCMACMASVWGLYFWLVDGINYHPAEVVLVVCGMNILIDRIIQGFYINNE